jgi:hypothetical protein
MRSKDFISASIVVYKEDPLELAKTIDCFLDISIDKKLFLIDNSPTDLLKQIAEHPDIEYCFIGKNIGFGSGHNTIISKIKGRSNYHLILNPDVTFEPSVITKLIEVLKTDEDSSVIQPKVLFPNGKHQFSSRKFPSIFELIVRRLGFLKPFFRLTIERGEYRDKDLSKPYYVDSFTGCFQLFKTNDFVEINGFDERYFLYMEDVDICRKLEVINKKKLYYPYEKIYHKLEKGSSKNIKLFLHHSISVFQYFYKWGVKNKKATGKND